jgi:4-hydroxy-4-methyl-2-oxoglutarate aldolase
MNEFSQYQRPGPDLIEACKQFPPAVLGDAMGRTGCMDSGIKPFIAGARVCGPALTLRCYPGDNLMCHYGLYVARAGDVLVVDGSGYTEGALWGGLLSLSARQKGLAGTIIDGAARDLEDLREIGYPVYARAITPRGVFKTIKGQIHVPVHCGGVTVHPGDLLVGDENGIVVLPSSQVSQIIKEARKVLDKEREIVGEIEKGRTIYETLKLDQYFRQ